MNLVGSHVKLAAYVHGSAILVNENATTLLLPEIGLILVIFALLHMTLSLARKIKNLFKLSCFEKEK